MPDDFIGEWEGVVDEAVKGASDDLKMLGRDIINRPYGSERVPLSTRMNEWALMKDYPEALIQYADDQGLSDETMVKHFKEMNRAYERWSKRNPPESV